MDRTQVNHSDEDDAADAFERKHSDGSDESEDGDQGGGEAASPSGDRGDLERDEEEDDDDDGDSDAETQRIGSSVLRFARRCVKTGEFAKAMAALQNVVEISELDALPCRQALLFAAQVFVVSHQETKALECMMELWDDMPPPYKRQDAQLLLAVIYEQLEQPRMAVYWFNRAFGGSGAAATPLNASLSAWLSLAERSYDEGDMIISTEAYTRAFGCIFQAKRWPADVLVFRFVGRLLSALVSVAHLRRDRKSYRQQIAFSLAVTLIDSGVVDQTPLVERAFDKEYLALRHVYAVSFPTIYAFLFGDEDRFVGRIARAWRVWRARGERKRAIAERERQAREAALAAKAARAAKAKKRQKKSKPLRAAKHSDKDDDAEQLQRLRQRTKARIESLRKVTEKASPPKPAPKVPEDGTKPMEMTVTSPTRRKLETVKRLRSSDPLATEQVSDDGSAASPPRGNQRPLSSEGSSSGRTASLLDVYAFPALASHRHAFEADAGRPQGPADIEDDELAEIEEFARMAHYRSRVLVQQHAPLQDVAQLDRVTPPWLRRFQDVLRWIESREAPPGATATHGSHFSEIHSRVVFQLTRVYTQYVLQHGKTAFTIQLTKLLRRLESWHFSSVASDLVPALRRVQALGEREEAHRNLEFFHARQHQQHEAHG